MIASYTSIAISSFIAALICFLVLAQMEKYQLFPINKMVRTLLLVVISLFLALITIWGVGLQTIAFNILLSTLIGAAITTWRQPIYKINKQ